MTELFFAQLAEALAHSLVPSAQDWPPELLGPLAGLRPAAVLVPLSLEADGEVRVVLTQRSAALRNHAGQIAFPGGSVAEGDLDRTATALREANEEVGLRPAACQVLGLLVASPVITRFEITPVVARIPAAYPFVLAAGEVSRLIVLRLRDFLAPGVLEVQQREVFGVQHEVLYYRVGDEVVWGATARILEQLLTVAAPLL